MQLKETEDERDLRLGYKLVKGGSVPGGHICIYDGRKPFITPMRECNSISLKHSDVVVDIGAYVGTYAIKCARFPVKKIIAYEPTPKTYNILKLTPLPNLKTVNAAIVNDDRKEVELFISMGIGVSNSIVPSRAKPNTISVPAINYVEAVKDATIVKIDIEGAEYELFYDSVSIVQPQLRAIIIDFHAVGKDWIKKAEKIIKDMTDAGFETVVKPKWPHGWTSCGSWIRPEGWVRPIKAEGQHEELMNGKLCCGCGKSIKENKKSLCKKCYFIWSQKDREGFNCAEK